ncbi:hypothetical protein BDY21DRAFT_345296 [Lineolata rhizophorae]|uniref:Uncharacterized protein n=1 Tax=Lineolata rhizophorae TaxID=578093 RepID=A0A6A6P0B9_9PEZI|nr:hypothetical protein BDY21DRAFT_345296 [Lineolata rhizophorae]
MRERITYLLRDPEHDGPDPSKINVSKDSLTVTGLDAAKEHRVTFGFSELSQELWRALKQCHELRIRWVSESPYDSTPPFVARLSPGLHVFFTPRRDELADSLCPMLKKVFGQNLKCTSPTETFTTPPILSPRFSQTSLQYHSLLPSLIDLTTYIAEAVCPPADQHCRSQAAALTSASYVDIDFDAISHSVIVNAFWSAPPTSASASDENLWTETILKRSKEDTVEVGVLGNERPSEKEELSLSGFLTVLGQDDHPSTCHFIALRLSLSPSVNQAKPN